ncbi:MAG: hypothetical protein U5R49_22065 [Deltaproteobacteria bacterium]|nr:hypothetical protein [Deltaproteobacteria bacterium]
MEFLAKDIFDITGVKRNRLQQWLEYGFILPSIQVASGHGSRNIWSREDLYTISLFKKITESGLSRKVASDFLSAGTLSGDNLDDVIFLLYMRKDGKTKAVSLYFKEGDDIVLDLASIQESLDMVPFDDVYIVNFAKLRESVDAAIARR